MAGSVMRRSDRPRLRSSGGQSLVELAIALPILLALLIGLVEMARAWNVRQVMTNAAREGARLAVLPTSLQDDVTTAVQSRLEDASLDPALWTIDLDGFGSGTGEPTTVTVRYTYSFQFLGPVVGLLNGDAEIPGTIVITTTSTMRNE